MKGRNLGHKPRVGPMPTGERAGNHAWRWPGALACPHAAPRLTWPPGGVRQLAAGPQLLTVSGAPLHGLWLCLIEDQGYRRRRPRSRARTVCVVVCGRVWHVCAEHVGEKVVRIGFGLGRTQHVDRVGPQGDVTCAATR